MMMALLHKSTFRARECRRHGRPQNRNLLFFPFPIFLSVALFRQPNSRHTSNRAYLFIRLMIRGQWIPY